MSMLDDRDQATADLFARSFEHIALDRPSPSERRDRTSRRWLAVASAVVLLSGAAFAALWPDGGSEVFAGWTPVPRDAAPGEVDGVLEVCNGRMSDAGLAAAIDPFDENALTEFRGTVALALVTVDQILVQCAARATADGWYAFQFGATPLQDTAPVLTGGGGPGEMTWLLRGVRKDAARVDVTVPGFPVIAATVVDGTYFAWWPNQDLEPDALESGLPELRIDIYADDDDLIDTIVW